MNEQISLDMHVTDCLSGIKLIAHDHPQATNTPTVAHLLELPISVYFLDSEGNTILINAEGANVCGFDTPNKSVGKSLKDVSSKDSAHALIDNCKDVMLAKTSKIFEEENLRQDGQSMQFLSVKMPWYDVNETIVGVMGVSIVLGKHSLSKGLSHLKALGLLKQNNAAEIPAPREPFKIHNVELTKRQMECLQLTVKGYTAKGIAQQLGISFRTVEEYLKNIRIKAGVNSKSDLIKMTIEHFYCH